MELSAQDKVRFLMEATRGPADCFALRSFDPSREQPHFWRPVYAPLDHDTVLRHLGGEIEIGAYALIPGLHSRMFPKCAWIVADFDGKQERTDWERDVRRFLSFITESGANILVNRSRSGKGVHVRVLFKEPVPAWMARRWMQAWVDEAGIEGEIDDVFPSSFDRLIPVQDTLRADLTYDGHRRPGNLVGTPMHRKLAVTNGGTLPISTDEALRGNFEPDGKHWEHLLSALERREWGEAELLAALKDAPGENDGTPPPLPYERNALSLTVLHGADATRELNTTRTLCEFFEMAESGARLPYAIWVALATELHHFGEVGHETFHQISALDPRYKAADAEQKWEQTAEMHPMRCDTLVSQGWRCPYLGSRRCNGAKAPAFLSEHAGYDPL